jgi:2-dehydropantoate 2-reductase
MSRGSICSRRVDRIAVVGPGGVGGFIAAALARASERVIVVAHEATAERITRDGIEVRSVRLGDFTAHPEAAAALRDPADVLIVATKATTLAAAVDRIEAQPALVVPLLNGIEHIQLLRERFGRERVAAGVIRIESDRPEPARIVQTSPFLRVDLASDDPALRAPLEELAAALERAEVPATVGASEAQIMWSKLVRLVALACTTSAADQPIGFVRSDPEWRRALEGCLNEAAAVARAEGAELDAAATLAELEEAHPGLRSSMQRDIAAGREPELDAIAGAVLRAGKRHGIECPTIARLAVEVAGRAGIAAPHV